MDVLDLHQRRFTQGLVARERPFARRPDTRHTADGTPGVIGLRFLQKRPEGLLFDEPAVVKYGRPIAELAEGGKRRR